MSEIEHRRLSRALALAASVLIAGGCVTAGVIQWRAASDDVRIDPESVPIPAPLSARALRFSEHDLGVELTDAVTLPLHSLRYCSTAMREAHRPCADRYLGAVQAARATAVFDQCPPGDASCTATGDVEYDVIVLYQSARFADPREVGIGVGHPAQPPGSPSPACASGPGYSERAEIYEAETEHWLAAVGHVEFEHCG